jgi:hypothetical protein
VIAERVGWDRSIRVLSGRVAELRPVYLPPDPAGRTVYAAGEIAQCDLFEGDRDGDLANALFSCCWQGLGVCRRVWRGFA